MARLLLPLLFSTVALLLPWGAADTAQARCSRPKEVANARIEVGNNTLLNARLRYVCNPGYKRKAGTSSLIQCILRDGSKPDWTQTTLQCIRDPALPPLTPSPELLTTLHAERMTQRAGTGDANLTSSPSPAAMPTGAAGQPPVPPAPDGSSPETSMAPEVPPPLETSTLGEGTTPLPTAPTHHAAASVQTLASSIVPALVFVVVVTACCYWRMKTRAGQDYTVTAIPMVAPAAENEEMLPPGTFPTG